MPSGPKSAQNESFEKNLERLDHIVHQLEDADLHLGKAIHLFEEGMRLSEVCHQQLDEAEGKVEVLLKKAGGKIVREPFASGEEDRDGS